MARSGNVRRGAAQTGNSAVGPGYDIDYTSIRTDPVARRRYSPKRVGYARGGPVRYDEFGKEVREEDSVNPSTAPDWSPEQRKMMMYGMASGGAEPTGYARGGEVVDDDTDSDDIFEEERRRQEAEAARAAEEAAAASIPENARATAGQQDLGEQLGGSLIGKQATGFGSAQDDSYDPMGLVKQVLNSTREMFGLGGEKQQAGYQPAGRFEELTSQPAPTLPAGRTDELTEQTEQAPKPDYPESPAVAPPAETRGATMPAGGGLGRGAPTGYATPALRSESPFAAPVSSAAPGAVPEMGLGEQAGATGYGASAAPAPSGVGGDAARDSKIGEYVSGANAPPPEVMDQRLQQTAQKYPGASEEEVNRRTILDAVKSGDLQTAQETLAGLRNRYNGANAIVQGAADHGDIETAAKLATWAHNHVPDSKNVTYTPDTYGGVTATVSNADGGGQPTNYSLTADQFRNFMVGQGTDFDHMIEVGADKLLQIASRQGAQTAGVGAGDTEFSDARRRRGGGGGGGGGGSPDVVLPTGGNRYNPGDRTLDLTPQEQAAGEAAANQVRQGSLQPGMRDQYGNVGGRTYTGPQGEERDAQQRSASPARAPAPAPVHPDYMQEPFAGTSAPIGGGAGTDPRGRGAPPVGLPAGTGIPGEAPAPLPARPTNQELFQAARDRGDVYTTPAWSLARAREGLSDIAQGRLLGRPNTVDYTAADASAGGAPRGMGLPPKGPVTPEENAQRRADLTRERPTEQQQQQPGLGAEPRPPQFRQPEPPLRIQTRDGPREVPNPKNVGIEAENRREQHRYDTELRQVQQVRQAAAATERELDSAGRTMLTRINYKQNRGEELTPPEQQFVKEFEGRIYRKFGVDPNQQPAKPAEQPGFLQRLFGVTPTPAAGAAAPAGQGGGGGQQPVRVNSPDEVRRLQPGTPYIVPDGRRGVAGQ